MKNALSILIGIALNLWTALGNLAIVTKLILTIQEHGLSFHLLMLSSISIITALKSFLAIGLLTSLGRFLSRYFITLM